MKLQVSNNSLMSWETHNVYLGIKFKIASYFPLTLQSCYFTIFLPYIDAAENFAVTIGIIPL